MKTLMVGATGKYAGLVLPELVKRGVFVRAVIRNENEEKKVRDQGASETVIGDLNNPESLQAAAEGMEAVFHINPAFAPNEAELGKAMVTAAKQAGVRHFVFSGVIHPSVAKMSNHAAKAPVEEAIYESGMTFTVLQPAIFLQTLDSGWGQVKEQNRFSLPYSNAKRVCYVDYRDVAEVAARALTEDYLTNGTFELSSSGMYSRIDLADLMTNAVGRTIEAGEPSFEDWVKMAGIDAGPVKEGLRRMYQHNDEYGFPGGNDLTLKTILGRQPRTVKEYIAELATR